MSEPEFETVGRQMRARDSSTYQAEVQRTSAVDGTWRWRIMRYNPPSTVPIGRPVLSGSANSRKEAETQALTALVRVAKT
jgi:hypothetical protein